MPKLRTSSKSTSQKQKDNSEEAGDEIAEQLDRAVRSDNSQKEEKKYQFPPIQLLKPKLNSDDSDAMEEMQNNAKKLIDTLTSFGVKASIVNICRGPSVTRYELQPAPVLKSAKLQISLMISHSALPQTVFVLKRLFR